MNNLKVAWIIGVFYATFFLGPRLMVVTDLQPMLEGKTEVAMAQEHGGEEMHEHAGHEHGGQALGGKEHKIVFHPPLVHFPIAFYFLEFVLILFWIVKKDEAFRRFALFSFRIGYLFMIAAMLAGYWDAGGIQNITGAVRTHALAAVSVFLLYTGRAFYWRFAKAELKNYRLIHLLWAALGTAAVFLTGYLGGGLVYG
jgi:uncharacterized membrane protein